MKFITAVITLILAVGVQARTIVDDAGREVVIPDNAQRVISQNDNRLTIPLIELGVPVVGSSGRLSQTGEPFMRAVPELTGVTFANSEIEFIGTYGDLDVEKITALAPDLIVTTRDDQLPLLEKIAPTVVFDANAYSIKDGMAKLANWLGRTEALQVLVDNYQRQLANSRQHLAPLGDVRANVIFSFPAGDAVYVYKTLGATTEALADLGITPSNTVQGFAERRTAISPEAITDVDADFVINFFDNTPQAGPRQVRAGLDNFMPSWCEVLKACQAKQFLLFPYASFGYGYHALGLNVDLLTTHIAGRHFTAITPESAD